MSPNKASALTNLVICIAVVASGFYWLRDFDQRYKEELRFLFRAYLCWWLSWLAWGAVWVLITLQVPYTQDTRDLITLAGSDLNAILLIMVYFTLTRGNRYKASTAWIEGTFLALIFFIGYATFYVAFDRGFAMRLQEKWGLILGAVSTILVGWAFALRYDTRVVLGAGFVYGFAQPAAFEAVLSVQARPKDFEDVFVAVQVILALLKILWATVVTRYFTQKPEETDSLITEPSLETRFTFFEKWPPQLFVQTFSLFAILVVLVLIFMPTQYMRVLAGIAALGAFCTIVTGLVNLFRWINGRVARDKPADSTS
jgi:hypothetical protein